MKAVLLKKMRKDIYILPAEKLISSRINYDLP